jgi:hypothetical protein
MGAIWFKELPPRPSTVLGELRGLRMDDGQSFHNPVREGLPTIREFELLVLRQSERVEVLFAVHPAFFAVDPDL